MLNIMNQRVAGMIYVSLIVIKHNIVQYIYRNDPKFSDRYARANSADPDQTASRGAV